MTAQAVLDFNAIQEQWKKQSGAMAQGVTVSGTKISTKNRVFTLPNGITTVDDLKLIVIDYRNYNIKYPAGKYDPKAPVQCWAMSSNNTTMHRDLIPSTDVEKPFNPTCEGCPMIQWNTGDGGKGKACKERVKIAVAPLEGFTEKTPAWLLDVSPTGIDSFARLVTLVTMQKGLPIQAGVTTIGFRANSEWATLEFYPTKWRPFTDAEREQAVLAYRLSQKPETIELLERAPSNALD